MNRYSDEIIEEVKNSTDIVDLISQYVNLKRRGRNFFGLCPFHSEKSPSFAVSPDKQIFHCFGCHAGGSALHFLMKIEGINFKEAIETLAERSNIQLPKLDSFESNETQILKDKVYEVNKETAQFYHERLYTPIAKSAQEYVKKRKLDNTTLKSFVIGFSGAWDELYKHLREKGFQDREILESGLVNRNENGKYIDRYRNRLMFPIQDVRGKIIAFGGRVLDDSKPKYINSPENIVYSKGRNLFGLNIAKQYSKEKIIIVEGYMDAISLHKAGIHNVVASLGTALTEAQGRLLRRYSQQVVIGYDSDGAGQAATMRGLEILQNLGCDVRVLQMTGAKDPDEYVIKYGSGRFQKIVDESISLVEFKVKQLRENLNIENLNEKIKFLNEIAKILSTIDNNIEKEIYIDKIARDNQISKEAIYAEVNKLSYARNTGGKVLEKNRVVIPRKVSETNKIDENTVKRENMVIFLLINKTQEAYEKFKDNIFIEDIKDNTNKEIIKILYEEIKKGNSNISNILDSLTNEDIIARITYILAFDFEISDMEKAIVDVLKTYEKEKMINEKKQIIEMLESSEIESDEKKSLEYRLNELIIKIARMN